MKLALISDIHSNLHALTVALREIERRRVDAIYCLGDIVGYGADPGPCVDLVRRYSSGTILGNHDAAVAKDEGVSNLPRDGQLAAKQNQAKLKDNQTAYLAELPLKIVVDNCTLVHATPKNPERWIRFDTLATVKDQFSHFDTDFCFVGHTHVPAIVAQRLGVFKVKAGNRYIINVGSVGQPRDENPMLGFVVFDTQGPSHELVRLSYDVSGAAASIKAAGLPDALGRRLFKGL